MITVIVTGGRDFTDADMMLDTLAEVERRYGGVSLIVQGGAPGADTIAATLARMCGISYLTYRADWDEHEKAAGPIRNEKMLNAHPDAIVVAMPGGRGTADCVRRAQRKGMTVVRPKGYDDSWG